MGQEIVRSETRGDVAVLHLDDGKANAISQAALAAIGAALDEAEKTSRAIALIGRPGRFSGGFDLTVMRSGDPAAIGTLVKGGAALATRLYGSALPVAVGCTGHAIAMGSLLLLSADTRIGAAGDFKIGLNEVAIGLTLPGFAIELARERLSKRHLQAATVQARLYDPVAAVDAGYLDRVVAPEALLEETVAEAERMAGLDPRAFEATKRALRGPALARLEAAISG